MRTTRQYSITLPLPMAEFIDARIASGQYATESEVIREGLRALKAKDDAYEAWLKNSAQHYQEWLENPSIGEPIAAYNRRKDLENSALLREKSRNAVAVAKPSVRRPR